MVKDENWGVSVEKVRQFFLEQPDVTQKADGFWYRDCRITLEELQSQAMGPWPLPRTRVQMEGSQEAVSAIHRRFFLRFLSAGG